MDKTPYNKAFAAQYYDIGINLQSTGGKQAASGNEQEAIKWLEKSAHLDFPPAQYKLGMLYFEGKRLLCDYECSYFWLSKAAEQGHIDARYQIGLMNMRGLGVTENIEAALNHFTEAAGKGHKDAMYMLGYIYCYDRKIKRDYVKAAGWFARASDAGHLAAKKELTKQISLKELIATI
jgi:TPR repeat protein